MRVGELMTKPVWTTAPGALADEAWELMRLHRVHHLVVLEGDAIAGVVSASDLGGAVGEPLRRGRRVEDFMTTHVVTATPRTTLREAANLMRGHAIECLPVFDDGKLAGMVTATELLELVGRGAERPAKPSRRHVLKDRGQQPAAKRRAGR